MHIEINSIKKDGNQISPLDFALSYRENFISILKSSLLENPLLESLKDKINMEDLKSIKIRINVITEGSSLFLPKRTDFAGIDFINYFDNKNKSIILQLHYGAYMGLRSFPLRRIISKAKRPENYFQIRDELSGYNLDPKGIKRILFHEFGHLMDALDPGFSYSNVTHRRIEQEESLHSIFESLWNCYLDRRLQNVLGWKSPYSYECSYLQEAQELLRAIWNTSKKYNFKELIDYSLQIQQNKQKQVVGK